MSDKKPSDVIADIIEKGIQETFTHQSSQAFLQAIALGVLEIVRHLELKVETE